MAWLDLYLDTFQQLPVGGINDSNEAELPDLIQNDTLNLRIRLLTQRSPFPHGRPTVYDFVPNAGVTLKLVVGNLGSTSYLTNQYTWGLNPDPGDPYFYAALPLNTSEISSALGSQSQISTLMQIRKEGTGGDVTTVLLAPITIKASLIQAGTLTPAPGQTPLSLEAAMGIFLTREIHGAVTWVNDNTGHKRREYLGDDDLMHDDPA